MPRISRDDIPLASWRLRNRDLLPIVQGGIGVGISAHRLAGSVARLGALGTFDSEIRPVADLVQFLMTGAPPVPLLA